MYLNQRMIAASRVLALGVLALVLLAASMLVPARAAHASTTFTVNHTGDAGDLKPRDGSCSTLVARICTLRAAIQEANATTGADTIVFDIPTTGVATIAPASAEGAT
jgi:CSLREA domain-containing protein